MKAVLLAAAALFAASSASAATIDFSNATVGTSGYVRVGDYQLQYLYYGGAPSVFVDASGQKSFGDAVDDGFGTPFQLTRVDGRAFDLRSVVLGTTGTSNRVDVGGNNNFYYMSNGTTINTPSLVGVTSVFFDTLSLGDSAGLQSLDVFASSVPEPATWAMMLLGFGMVGFALRRRTKQTVRIAYS